MLKGLALTVTWLHSGTADTVTLSARSGAVAHIKCNYPQFPV